MRVALAASIGLVVGAAVDAISNAALSPPWDLKWPPNLTGFWGVVYGSFAAAVAFGIALWVFNRSFSRPASIGRWIAALTLGLFGLVVVLWIAMWGVPPLSLEGAWMYPLAAVSLIAAVAVARASSRHRGSRVVRSR